MEAAAQKSEKVGDSKKIFRTVPKLSQYELAFLLSKRSEEIINKTGAPIHKDVPAKIVDPLEIAAMEFRLKQLPLILCRYLPGSTVPEERDPNQMEVDTELYQIAQHHTDKPPLPLLISSE